MATKSIENVEIFASGGPWNGRSFTENDLDAIVSSFNELAMAGRVPVKIGHDTSDGAPAAGWIEALRRDGDKLLADLGDVSPELIQDIKDGKFRHVSVELLQDAERNGKVYKWMLDGLAVLGAGRPAVSSLERLDRLVASSLPGLACRARFAFTQGGDDQAALRTQIAALQAQLLRQQQDNDIRTGRCLPSERVRFDRRYRDAAAASVEDWIRWVADAPRPAPLNQTRGTDTRSTIEEDSLPPDADPDQQVVFLARQAVEKSGGKLSYFAAQREVLTANPELARRYVLQPGTK